MEVKLVVAKGKLAGRAIPVTVDAVTGPKFFIGRAPECHLRPKSNRVSRHHCALLIDEGVLTVRDFGSTNGTLVNGERIRGQRQLHHGDRLTVGPLDFDVHLGTSSGQYDADLQRPPEPAAGSIPADQVATSDADDGGDIMEWLAADSTPAVLPGKYGIGQFEKPSPGKSGSEAGSDEATAAGVSGEPEEEAAEISSEEEEEEAPVVVSEDQKEEMRRQGAIVGVSKAAQAKRLTETTRDAAADALKKFFD